MDPAVLLQSKGDDSPSGENLEYDPSYSDMEVAGQPGAESQIGEEIIPAKDPNYRDLATKSLVVLEQSHDIRAAVFLADAILYTEGLAGFANVTTYILGCLTGFWDTCHPELDEFDDNDPTMRINAVQGLGRDSTVIRSLRRTPLTDSRSFGKMSLREIDVAEGKMTAPSDMATVPDSSAVSSAFQDTEEAFLTGLLEAAKTAEDNVKAISAVFDENTPGQGPDLDELVKLLRLIRKKLAENSSSEDVADVAEDGEDQSAAGGGAAPAASMGGAVGAINSPSDVSNAIDRIIAYYKRAEPSSPVPIVLERAKRLVGADFLTIMADIAPLGISNVHLVGGIDDD